MKMDDESDRAFDSLTEIEKRAVCQVIEAVRGRYAVHAVRLPDERLAIAWPTPAFGIIWSISRASGERISGKFRSSGCACPDGR
jgi:hypothetical protein